MPTIPVYGYDELEPSLLNKAKRRVTGIMDISEKTLTLEPETDPTKGGQNGLVEKLTEDIYSTIKDIEILISIVRDDTDIEELKLGSINPDVLSTLDPASASSAVSSRVSITSSIRPIIKQGAKQLIIINNGLRKINSTYDTIQPNMVYTSLKQYTGFLNAMKILKKTVVFFFEVTDSFLLGINNATNTPYNSPAINDDEDPDIEEEENVEQSDIPPILSTAEPFPALPPAPFDPSPLPNYEPLPPPLPPPPPRKRLPPNIGKQMKDYKDLILKVLNDNNIIDPQIANDFEDLAIDYVRNTKTFYSEAELNTALTTLTPVAPVAPAPIGTTPLPPIGTTPLPPKGTTPIQPLPPIAASSSSGRRPPPRSSTDPITFQTANTVRERARIAGLNITQRDEIVKEAITFIRDNRRDPTDDEIDNMIEAYKLLGARPAPITLAPPAELQKIDDLVKRANTIKGTLTNKKTIELINDGITALIDARDTASKTASLKIALKARLDIADEPTIVVNQTDYKKIPEGIIKNEFIRVRMYYINSKDKLERSVFYRKKKAFTDFLNDNNIPYIETKVRSKIDALEGLIGQPSSF